MQQRETPLLLNYFFKVSKVEKNTKKHNHAILVVNEDIDNG